MSEHKSSTKAVGKEVTPKPSEGGGYDGSGTDKDLAGGGETWDQRRDKSIASKNTR